MKIQIIKCSLFDLKAGDLFFIGADESPFMAVGEAADGKRNVVRLETGDLFEMRASESVRPAPNAELIVRKA